MGILDIVDFPYSFSIFHQHLLERPKKLPGLKFEDDLLAKNAIEKIVVINKEVAQIYIKKVFWTIPNSKMTMTGYSPQTRDPNITSPLVQ